MNNTIAKSVAIKIFFFSLLIGVSGAYIFYTKANDLLINHIVMMAQMISEARAGQVDLFLRGNENRVVDFSSDGFIKNSLYDIKHNKNKKEAMVRLSNHFLENKLPVNEHLYKVFALGVNGVVVASTDDESVGQDMAGDPIFLIGESRPYIKSLSYDDVSNVKSLVLSAPVIRDNEFVGVIVIRVLPDALMDIMTKKSRFNEGLDTYIINKDGYLITPSGLLKGENKGILTQMVDTENSKECLEDLEKFNDPRLRSIEEHEEELAIFKNYQGEEVIGMHHYIPYMEWCVLSEINKSVVWDGWRSIFMLVVILIFIGSGVISLIGFLVIRKIP